MSWNLTHQEGLTQIIIHSMTIFANFFFLHFPEQRSPATFQYVLIVLSRSCFSSPSHLRNTSRWFATSFRQICYAYSYKWHPPGVSRSCNFLAAATILQLLILHLPSKKSTLGVTWLQILLQDFSHCPVANLNVLARFQCK